MPRPSLQIGGVCRQGHPITGPDAIVVQGRINPRPRCRLCANRRPTTPRKAAYVKAWTSANPERVRAAKRRYAAKIRTDPTIVAHRRQLAQIERAARKAADPDAVACREAYATARGTYGPGDYDFAQWAVLWSGPCFDCEVTPARGVDHIVGERAGGTNELANLQPACLAHNHSKAGYTTAAANARRRAAA